ncbi:MAG: DUF4149 domain-containing protein [Candidatus Acidiferrales bacterium]
MTNFLRFLQVLALGTWIGSIFYFSAVVAPTAFAVLGSTDEAGRLVGPSLSRLHLLGLIAAIVYLLAGGAIEGSIRAFGRPGMIGVVLMVLLTAISQNKVTHRMAELRTQMGSVEKTPPTDPRRAEFDKLHSVSVGLEGAVFLIGLASLYLTVRNPIE